MNKTSKNKIMQHIVSHGKECAMYPKSITFSVNCVKHQDYPRDVYRELDDAVEIKLKRGHGFTLGAGFSGGWKSGNTCGTSDIGFVIADDELLNILLQ